jgi:hypothetical protein
MKGKHNRMLIHAARQVEKTIPNNTNITQAQAILRPWSFSLIAVHIPKGNIKDKEALNMVWSLKKGLAMAGAL